MSLNKSKWYKGEDIRGEYNVTIQPTNPLSVIDDLTGTVFELIVKSNISDEDVDALATLTSGNGLTITATSIEDYKIEYSISGEATEDIVSSSTRDTIVEIFYEFNATYPGTTQSDVLDTGIIKIETNRVKKTL